VLFQPAASTDVVVPDVAVSTTTTPPPPAQRARRPTTLAYCARTVALPRVRRVQPPPPAPANQRPPTAAVVTVAAEVVAPAQPPPPARVVAPTATPEDSYVEGGSSSCGAADLDSLPADYQCDKLTEVEPTPVAASIAQHRPRTPDTTCLETTQSIPEVDRHAATAAAATQRPRRAAVRRIHRVIVGARQRLLRQLGHRSVADEKPTAATAFVDDRPPSYAAAAAAVEGTSSRGSLLAAAEGVAPSSAAELEGCWSAGSSTPALSDPDTPLAIGADVSPVPGGHRVSPASPSYDDRHARFSHVGAHALDVFFSPDDDDDDDYDEAISSDRSDSGRAGAASASSLWRPLASCSGVLLQQQQPSTSFHVPTLRPVAPSDLAASGPRLPSVPEAVWRSRDDASNSVHGPSGGVAASSCVLSVLSPTEATPRSSSSSTLAGSADNCSASAAVAAAAAVESDGSRLLSSDHRLMILTLVGLP